MTFRQMCKRLSDTGRNGSTTGQWTGDNKDDTFHNEWQAYRTRKANDLTLNVDHEYLEPGEYTVVVKVIDILGNDTTKAISVKVAGRGK